MKSDVQKNQECHIYPYLSNNGSQGHELKCIETLRQFIKNAK